MVFRDRKGRSQGEMSDSNRNNSRNGVMVQLVKHLAVKCEALIEIISTHIKSQIGYYAVVIQAMMSWEAEMSWFLQLARQLAYSTC